MENDELEPITFSPSGTITMQLNDGPIRLRIPTNREQADLTDLLMEAQEGAMIATAELQKLAAEKKPEGTPEDTAEERKRVQDILRSLQGADGPMARAVSQLLTTLGDRAVPAFEDLPMWTASPQLLNELISHWRTAPLDFLQRRKATRP